MARSGCANSRRSRRFGDNDELPDDVEDDETYVAIPDKRELGLGDHPCLLLEIEERHNPGGLNRINDSLSALGCEGFYFERGKRRPARSFDRAGNELPSLAFETGNVEGSSPRSIIFCIARPGATQVEKKRPWAGQREAESGYPYAS
jgi:hypothetical protein